MQRKLRSLLAVLLCVFVVSPFMDIPEVNAASQSEAVAWAQSQVGKGLDYDGVYGNQCVDLIKYYYDYFGVASYAHGNANEYITNSLPSGWTRVTSNFQAGDVAVWKVSHSCSTCSTGSLGHVGIIISNNGTTFTAVNQNFSDTAYCTTNTFNCSALECAIRPSYTATHTHSYTSSVTKEPTCTADGVRTYTCSCGNSYTEAIAKKGHSYVNTVVAPTLTEKGYTIHKCSVCGDTVKDTYVAAPVLGTDGWYTCSVKPSDVTSDKYTIEYKGIYEKIQTDSPGSDWTNVGTVKDEWQNSGSTYTSESDLETSDARVLVSSVYYHFCGPNAGNEGNYEQSGNFVHWDSVNASDVTVTSSGMDGTHPYYLLSWNNGNGVVWCASGTTCDGSYGSHGNRCKAWYKMNTYQDRVKVTQYKYRKETTWSNEVPLNTTSTQVRFKLKSDASGNPVVVVASGDVTPSGNAVTSGNATPSENVITPSGNASNKPATSSDASNPTVSGDASGNAVPAQVKINTIYRNSGRLYIKWNPIANADGYKVYRAINGGKYYSVGTIKGTSSGCNIAYYDNTLYQFKVVAYNSLGEAKVSDPYVIFYMSQSKPYGYAINKKKIKVSWSKSTIASYYELQYATKSNFSNKKTIKLKGTSKVLKNLTRNKKYYIRVRNVKTFRGKTYYSGWSSKLAIKTYR